MLRLRRQRGAAAVEFALLLPVLMLILVGIMEFGYAFFIQASVANATRVGMRDYAINYSKPNAQFNAVELVRAGVPDATAFVDGTFSATCAPSVQDTLTVTYRYRSLTGLLDQIVGNNVIVTGKASMQCGA